VGCRQQGHSGCLTSTGAGDSANQGQVRLLPLVLFENFMVSNLRRTKMNAMKTALDEVIKARSLLLLDHHFWGMLALQLKLIEDSSGDVETASTDGQVMLFNPEFIQSLTMPELIGTEAHEVMHCAMGDIWRLDERDPQLWNAACDLVNNLILVDAGFTLPQGALVSDAYRGMSKEEVYRILEQKAGGQSGSQPGKGQGQGKGKPGNGKGQGKGQGKPKGKGKGQKPAKGPKHPDPGKCGTMHKPKDQAKSKETQTQWKIATAAAAQRTQGELPGGLRRMINDEVLDPPLPWHVLLRDFVCRTARNDYNWTRPNRRYISRGFILPSLISDELPLTVVAIDSSASTEQFQARFGAEASAVLGSFQTRIIRIYCDAQIQDVKEYGPEDLPLEIEAKGYGGTNFIPVFDYIEKEGIIPACLIYLTDLRGRFPQKEPDYPVMWVNVESGTKAPWGEVVEMKLI
jgi:predicted metal-dependent peptidase